MFGISFKEPVANLLSHTEWKVNSQQVLFKILIMTLEGWEVGNSVLAFFLKGGGMSCKNLLIWEF